MKKLAFAVAATLAPGAAWAHPNHLTNAHYGLVHLLTDPYHLSMIGLAVALAFATRQALRHLQR